MHFLTLTVARTNTRTHQNSAWGYRDIDDMATAALERGLVLGQPLDMPANNHILVFTKRC